MPHHWLWLLEISAQDAVIFSIVADNKEVFPWLDANKINYHMQKLNIHDPLPIAAKNTDPSTPLTPTQEMCLVSQRTRMPRPCDFVVFCFVRCLKITGKKSSQVLDDVSSLK